MSETSQYFQPLKKEDYDHNLFETNLANWQKFMPAFADLLVQYKDTPSYLISDNKGGLDICYNGHALLNGRSDQWSEECKSNFYNGRSTHRIFQEPRWASDYTNTSACIELATIKRIKSEAKVKLRKPIKETISHHTSFHLVIFGVGLAEQIPLLVEASDCRNLVLIEPNIEFLYCSLYTFDWLPILTKFSDGNRKLSIIVDRDPELVFRIIKSAIKSYAPHLIDGMTLFESYYDTLTNLIASETKKRAAELVMGAGWFDDEYDCVKNAYLNLQTHTGPRYLRQKMISPFPALIVGSGPSLDDSFDALRKYQEHAIVISCGTTIRLLLREGIQPDFHVELENTPEIVDVCATVANSYDLSAITLIASNTVAPNVSKSFGKTVYFFRDHVSSKPIFSLGEDSDIQYSLPTVANLGLGLAQELGCTDFYLFGVDLGTRDIRNHHAKGSAYESGELPFEDILNIPIQANLGGKYIWSDEVFLWSKELLESSLHTKKFGRRYFNCSDGARISGMIPILPNTLEINTSRGKKDYIETIISKFPLYTKKLFNEAWAKANLRKGIIDLQEQLLDELDMPDNRSILDLLNRLTKILTPTNGPRRAEHNLYQGSLFHSLSAMLYFTNRVTSPEDLMTLRDIGKQAISAQIREIATQVINLCEELESTSSNTR